MSLWPHLVAHAQRRIKRRLLSGGAQGRFKNHGLLSLTHRFSGVSCRSPAASTVSTVFRAGQHVSTVLESALGGANVWPLIPAIVVLSLFLPAASFADTNIFSPTVSYLYSDATNVLSPTVSYLSSDAIPLSAVVSYQYFEWPGDDILKLRSNPLVSYFYGFAPGNVSLSNVRASQRAGTTLVDLFYDLSGNGSAYSASVAVSSDAGASFTVPATHFTGDGVTRPATPGTSRHIIWDAGADLGPGYFPDAAVRLSSGQSSATSAAFPVDLRKLGGSVKVSPGSLAADGASKATVTVTLVDANGAPLAGKQVIVTAVLQLASGGAVMLSTVTQPAGTTDANGQATATLTSARAGTAIISATDVTDGVALAEQPKVQFVSALIAPGQDLSDAIAGLVSAAGNDLAPYLANLALDEGRCGDYFQNRAQSERAQQAAITLNAGLGALLAPIPLNELLGPGASALEKGVFDGATSLIEDFDHLGLGQLIEDIAGSSAGQSLEAQDIGSRNAAHAQALLQAEQDLSAGVPPGSASASADFAVDLGLRRDANQAIRLILISQDSMLSAMQSDSEFRSTDFLTPLFTTVDVIGAIWGGIAATEAINAIESFVEWEQNRANLDKDQHAFLTAASALMSCMHFSDVIYSNTASGLSAVAEGRRPNPLTGSLGSVASHVTGPQYDINGAWGGADPVTTPAMGGNMVTGGATLVPVQNTGEQSAAFTAYAVSQHTVGLWVGVGPVGQTVTSLPYPQLTTATATIPAGQTATLQLNYFDGVNGALPDSGSQITIYVLAHNDPDFFNVGQTTSTLQWASAGPAPKGQQPTFTFENPIKCYVSQSPTNQAYQAQIWVANPFLVPLFATVTQPLPPGITILGTDGALQTSSIVWSNTVQTNGLAKDSFSFTLFVAPGAQTNLPPATVVFTDATGTNSLSLNSFAAPFSGLFPVGVNGCVPTGTWGAGTAAQLAVTNFTATSQSGSLLISLADSTGSPVTNFSMSFSVDGQTATNLAYVLPGGFAPGAYAVTGVLSMDGGSAQVFSGTYVLKPAPVWLGPGPATGVLSDGFTLQLEGTPGYGYLIQCSTNLLDWQPAEYLLLTNSPGHFTDYYAPLYSERFYRAIQVSTGP